MDDFTNLLVLCILMFGLTFIIGYLPMIFKLSENKLESISIFGAGFLLGTALIVIVPEGLSVLMETSGILQPNHEPNESGNAMEVNMEQAIYKQLSEDIDIQNINADLEEIQNNRLLLQAHHHDHDHQHQPNPVILVDHSDDDHSHSHDHEEGHHHHTHDPIVHSVFRKMGSLICFGFIFMMIVEKLSAHSHSHGHHSYSHKDTDTESLIESSPKHHHHGHNHGNIGSGGDIVSFMIGLLTHSAVDGIALGAVSSEGNATSLSLLVFIALMAHKGPAAISMTAFLKRKLSATLAITQDGKIKREIIKQLLFFSGAAPIAAILTYLILNSISYFMENDSMDNESGEIDELGNETQLLGSCLLFSGGTFLYVVTLHIIPEIKEWRNSHNESDDSHANLSWFDLVILTVGCIVPSLFEHSH